MTSSTDLGAGIRPLIAPKSIAILGASDDPGRIGGKPIDYSRRSGFAGPIYPVNPNRETVQGLKAYASVTDLPEPVDCAIVAVPSKFVVQSIQDCADKGVKSCLVFSAGFSEMGEEGVAAQLAVADIAKQTGLRIQGPNCLGLFNASIGWYATFSTAFERNLGKISGPVAFATQSGAYGSHLIALAHDRKAGVSQWTSTGNEVDVELAECIAYYAMDENVKVIVAQAEGARNGERLRAALELARDKGKPVIFVKIGRSEIGATAAQSHTAALVGADTVYEALFRQTGAYRADGMIELLEVLHAAEFGIFPESNKLGIMSLSGGLGIQMADSAEDCDLELPEMPAEAQKEALEMLPFSAPRNPFDVTAQALNQPELLVENLRLMLKEGDYDSIAIFLAVAASSKRLVDILVPVMKEVRADFPEKLIVLSMSGPEDMMQRYLDAGFPYYEDGTSSVKAIAAMTHFGTSFARGRGDAPLEVPMTADAPPVSEVSEFEAKQIIASAGIRVTQDYLARNAEEAVEAHGDIGGKVVLKIASADIAHKTEIGGVLVGLSSAEEVAEGYETLMMRGRTARPDAKIDGIIVSEMIEGGVETVMGVHRDPLFGPVVMFGLGGVFVEVLKDVTFRLAPFGVDEAHRMIREINGFAMLQGVRGAPPSDIDALADALARLSSYAAKYSNEIDSIDINPIIALPEGEGVVAVDALIIPTKDES